jgi:4-hydroxy-3-polyprenylbenzoate decarboxylase
LKNNRNIIIAVTGASGQIYAKRLFLKLASYNHLFNKIAVCFSNTGKEVYQYENNENFEPSNKFILYNNNSMFADIASGSANYDTMIICPCSMGTLARIANGISNDLITRAADVILKEKQKLILVTRETPLNTIHINNLKTLADAGATILPASPSFYNKPNTINELADTVVDRILKHININANTKTWNPEK